MSTPSLPSWAEEMRGHFRSGSASQFIFHGNVFDLVPAGATGDGADALRFVSLRRFLSEVMFEPFDVVLQYDRGRGIRAPKGGPHFARFLKAYDAFRGTKWASLPGWGEDENATLDLGNLLPKDPPRALALLDRFLRASQHHSESSGSGERRPAPLKTAVIVDYAHLIAPQGEPLHLSGDLAETLIQLFDWASDPTLSGAYVATVLITENLTDLNRMLVENPYAAKIRIGLPGADEIGRYVEYLAGQEPDFERLSEVPRETLASKLTGLSRVNVRSLVLRAVKGGEPITQRYLTAIKKELIEKEALGRIAFIESPRSLDDVAGHREAKAWLRQDADLLRRGRLNAIPMGYLLCGRIGTGKTFLVECWAGEVGVPMVEIKNFREKWVGATEGNLERIFNILKALGQVIVFIDEADQMTGRRGGGSDDSGLSGRVYGMLAKAMSDTANRGRILWVFATSRPDLLEVDLKRQGRLDVHIPLFPPQDAESRQELFTAMARKVGLGIPEGGLPALPDDEQISGNEMEGILVRALRLFESQPEGEGARGLAEIIAEVVADVRPSAHVERLEFMDLLAVKECTDARFLPPRYRDLPLGEVNRRIEALRLAVGE